jgi:hypothetical protein
MAFPATRKSTLLQADTREAAVVSIVGYFYNVDFGPGVHPQVHRVGKDKRCSCPLGAGCPAVAVVAAHLKAGGERAPDPPPGYFPVAPTTCPICNATTVYDHRLSSKRRGAGWRCTRSGSLHYWETHTRSLQQKLADNPWLFPPVVLREGVQIPAYNGIEKGDIVLYPGLKRDDIP